MAYYGSLYDGYSAEEGYLNLPAYLIFDQKCFEEGSVGNTNENAGWGLWAPEGGYIWSEDNVAELDRGWIVQSDTIEGLCGLLGIDGAVVASTIEEYNRGCDEGEDDFGREVSSDCKIGEGPYYGVQIAPGLCYTIGGPKTDIDCRVLDWNNEPIARLFAAGDIGQGMFLNPIGIPGDMAMGRIAARNISQLEKW